MGANNVGCLAIVVVYRSREAGTLVLVDESSRNLMVVGLYRGRGRIRRRRSGGQISGMNSLTLIRCHAGVHGGKILGPGWKIVDSGDRWRSVLNARLGTVSLEGVGKMLEGIGVQAMLIESMGFTLVVDPLHLPRSLLA